MKMTADFLLSRLIHNTGTLRKYAKVTFFSEMYTKGVLSKWYTKGKGLVFGEEPLRIKLGNGTPSLTPRETHAFFGREIGLFHFHQELPRTKLCRKPNSQVSEVNPVLLWHGDWPAPIPHDEEPLQLGTLSTQNPKQCSTTGFETWLPANPPQIAQSLENLPFNWRNLFNWCFFQREFF